MKTPTKSQESTSLICFLSIESFSKIDPFPENLEEPKTSSCGKPNPNKFSTPYLVPQTWKVVANSTPLSCYYFLSKVLPFYESNDHKPISFKLALPQKG